MAHELLFEAGPPGEYHPAFPRSHMDGPTLEHEARIRGMSPEQYVAEALAVRYSTGKPMFRVAPRASDEVRGVAAEVKEQDAAEARESKPKVPLGTKPGD